jgi:hypothetical protein
MDSGRFTSLPEFLTGSGGDYKSLQLSCKPKGVG